MPNDVSSNPFKLDSVSPSNGAPVSGILAVKGIRWIAPSGASGNQVQIFDPKTSKILWEACLGPNDKDKESCIPMTWPNGFYVSKIDSGVVEIYHDRELNLSTQVPSVCSTL